MLCVRGDLILGSLSKFLVTCKNTCHLLGLIRTSTSTWPEAATCVGCRAEPLLCSHPYPSLIHLRLASFWSYFLWGCCKCRFLGSPVKWGLDVCRVPPDGRPGALQVAQPLPGLQHTWKVSRTTSPSAFQPTAQPRAWLPGPAAKSCRAAPAAAIQDHGKGSDHTALPPGISCKCQMPSAVSKQVCGFCTTAKLESYSVAPCGWERPQEKRNMNT